MEEDFVKFFPEPKTVQEFESNVNFQISNVQGWISIKDYECALIKAKCLVEAIEKLIAHSDK